MNIYDTVMKLALERGFYFPSCEIYADAHAGFWEYGPMGNNLKNKFIELWRRELLRRDDMIEIDGSQIMSKNVFVASGHLDNFSDPIIKCKNCGATFRADRYITEKTGKEIPELLSGNEIDKMINEYGLRCASCNGTFHASNRFNMMFKVEIGPSKEEGYLRPETCQTIFVDFLRIFKTMRGRLPLAVAQVGKSFRNEIAPRQSLLRLREFYQAEIEVFCNPNRLNELPKFEQVRNTPLLLSVKNSTHSVSAQEAIREGYLPNKLVAYYMSLLSQFYSKTGINMERTRFRQLSEEEKAFYASTAFDFEVETSSGWLELVACNYRSDYDLKRHSDISKQNLYVMDSSDNTKVLPHLFELSMGIDRSIYSILEHSYYDDTESKRVVLKLVPRIAPVLVGVFPLVTKDGLREKAHDIYSKLKLDYSTFYDESGSIGRRYRRLEEIGAPFALTIDNQTMKDDTVTIRHRDSMSQDRIKVSEISNFLDTVMNSK
jgi:glycyl-tRNA synthetase